MEDMGEGGRTYTIENHQPVLCLQLTEGSKHESAGTSTLVYEQRKKMVVIIKKTHCWMENTNIRPVMSSIPME